MTKGNNRGIRSDDDPTIADDTHWQQAAQRHYDPDRVEGLTAGIVFAIAAAEDVAPIELTSPPLYEVVDVAGIEQSFFGANQSETARQGTGNVEFRYAGYLVKLRSDGWIQVYEPTEPKSE